MFKNIVNNLKNLFTRESHGILSTSFMMMFLILFAKFFGLFTKIIIVPRIGAEKFGLFVTANTLPEIISNLLIFGTITSVIIPILIEVKETEGRKAFSRLFSSVVNGGFLVFVFISILIAIFAGQITPFFIEQVARPAIPYSQEDISQIVGMMRVLLIPQIILGVSSILTSALHALKRFFIPQIAPVFYNLGLLFGIIVLVPIMGASPWVLVYGTLIGAIFHLLVQIPLVVHLEVGYEIRLNLFDKKIREILTIGLPRILSIASDQIAIAIDRGIAIGISKAAIGAYYLAISIVSLPFSLFTNTFSLAALPHLSEAYAKKDINKFKTIFTKVFNQIFFLTVPMAVSLLVLRVPLVRLFYGLIGKEFTWDDTRMVAWVVFFFSIGLIAEVMNVFLNRTFYAIKDTIHPFIAGSVLVVGGIVSGILFTNYFSHFNEFSLRALRWNPEFFWSKEAGISAVGGLGLSSSVVYIISFFILLYFLIRKIGNLDKAMFWLSMIRKFIFGVFMFLLMYGMFKMWADVLDTAKPINVFVLTFSTIIPGFVLYLWLIYIFKDPETEMISKALGYVKKLIRKPKLKKKQ